MNFILLGVCLIVELRTPAMPFGLGAFVAVKLRSLCWQHRFEQGWYCREAEGPEQAESVIKSPEKGRVLRVARKRRLSKDVYG